MESLSALDMLREKEEKTIQSLIAKLNNNGIASDKDKVGLEKVLLDKWLKQCDNYLAEKGYCGGALKTWGKFYDSYSHVNVLFDENIWDYASVEKYMDNYLKNYK